MTDTTSGVSIPFRIDPATGGVAWQRNESEKIKENIIHILMTNVGERVMRRKYGGGLRQLIHDPNNQALNAIVQHQIARTIGRWEPRVVLQSVTVAQNNGLLIADLQYIVRRHQQTESLSVPLGIGGM